MAVFMLLLAAQPLLVKISVSLQRNLAYTIQKYFYFGIISEDDISQLKYL